jgi:hypothetical protein
MRGMLVFVDESGDAGMKLGLGSTPHFVVVIVIFDDPAEALRCDRRIGELRTQLRLGKAEFRFNKCSDQIRVDFLTTVATFSFRYVAFVLDKGRVTQPELQSKDSLYRHSVKLAFRAAWKFLDQAKVVLDGSADREFQRQLSGYLRKAMPPGAGAHISRVTLERSHSNNLLQLADMICGAVARRFRENRADAAKYWALIRQREVALEVWPH